MRCHLTSPQPLLQKCSLIRNQDSHGRSEQDGDWGPGLLHTIHLNLTLAMSRHSAAQFFSGQQFWADVTCEGTALKFFVLNVTSDEKYSVVPIYIYDTVHLFKLIQIYPGPGRTYGSHREL